ncbi:MAG TPA: DUF3575 domain-containing protein [Chitinophagaceae bacterium]
MQKTIKFSAIFYLCFISFAATAQKEKNEQKEKERAVEKKNILKINLPALAFKNISVQYERQVGKKSSVSINVHTIPFGQLPFQSAFKNLASNSGVQYDQFKLGSFGVVPEFRFYLGKKGNMHGFYIGPFLSISNYKMSLPISYTSGTSTKTGFFNGNLNAITGGIQFGAQFSLGKNVVLDWWLFGPNYGSASGTLNFAATSPLSQSDQDDLKTKLEQVKNDVPLNTIKSYTVNANGASVVAKGPWGGLRGLGFSLGFRF